MKKKRFLGILLSLALVLGLMPGMSVTAYAAASYGTYLVTDSDTESTLPGKVVHFNNVDWYIIADDSTAANAGTVTLFAKDPIDKSQFNDLQDGYGAGSNVYKDSVVQTYLNDLTSTGSFSEVKDAIAGTKLDDVNVDNAKLWLLSVKEAEGLNESVRKCTMDYWWLRSPGYYGHAACVEAYKGEVYSNIGGYVDSKYGVRPALKLNLSSVIFSSESKTFVLKQTIAAENVTVAYGDTDKKVSASVTNPPTGGGAISYTVKTGSEDFIAVDSTTGALTIKKVPSDGRAYVIVTAAESGNYGKTTKEVTVTINKANAAPAIVTANNCTYDGAEKPLVTVTGTATGGTMQYALGTKDAATQPYSTSIPSATNAGTYYVWYKVIGDADHCDSSPAVVTVTIATKQSENKQPEKNTPAKESEQKVEGSLQLNSRLRLYWKGSNVVFKWGKVSGADTYEIWMAYCGSKKLKKVATVSDMNKVVIKKLGGKKPDQKRKVRAHVTACRNGTKIGRSLECHSAGPKNRHTNAKKIKTAKNTYKLMVGKATKVKAKTIKIKSSRPLLGKGHGARLRYASSDNHIATVSKGGKIRAVSIGKCNVWVYAKNGISRKVTVIVQ